MTDKSPTIASISGSPTPDILTKPPLLIKSILEMAWGLTLSLSTNQAQSTLGTTLSNYLLALFQSANFSVPPTPPPSSIPATSTAPSTAPSPPYPANSDDPTKLFLENLIAAISTYLRRMGFEKDIYDRFLDTQKNWLQRKSEYWKSMGDMTSFSGDSTIVKIAAFFGIGTGGASITESINSATSNSHAADNVTKVAENLSKLAPSTTLKGSSTFPHEILFISLICGVIGLFSVIIFLKRLGNNRVTAATRKTNRRQDEYWKQVMRPRYKEQLEYLYSDIVYLMKHYYPNYNDDPLINPDNTDNSKLLDDVIDKILPDKEDMYSAAFNKKIE